MCSQIADPEFAFVKRKSGEARKNLKTTTAVNVANGKSSAKKLTRTLKMRWWKRRGKSRFFFQNRKKNATQFMVGRATGFVSAKSK